ncbi:hypothetical protein P7F88_04905 [Vibrio hannami]|uniref:hypothetical protein n=1 Tax=Vibrio hannami TaxID=2717094 RepID=UPI00240EE244|nr:hypothetical protein [Vibrio hannami]MDG3085474.1 hypothetical protein [Vibrio hannami]
MDGHKLEDSKINCLSILQTINVKDYLDLVEDIYKHHTGGIKGQRAPLRTKTAQTIRARMVKDIEDGAVLPPLVIGAEVSQSGYDKIRDSDSFITLLTQQLEQGSALETNHALYQANFSIIDGMQRTTAIMEAIETAKKSNDENKLDEILARHIRVEFWISTSLNSLIYRMLVLNTGQVPWDMKRQLNTIYEPIIRSLNDSVDDLDIKLLDDSGRRAEPGQHQSSKLIEYFLCFTSRKPEVDIKEKVAEDFARMDAIAATSNGELLNDFIRVISWFVKLDHAVSKTDTLFEGGKFKKGKDLFTSVTAGAGFVAAAAEFIFGPPGFELDFEEAKANLDTWCHDMQVLISKIEILDNHLLDDFLQLELLNEKVSSRSGKVGTFERDFFHKAFSAMFKYNEKLQDLKPCWMAR